MRLPADQGDTLVPTSELRAQAPLALYDPESPRVRARRMNTPRLASTSTKVFHQHDIAVDVVQLTVKQDLFIGRDRQSQIYLSEHVC
jgi:hypothetical protein